MQRAAASAWRLLQARWPQAQRLAVAAGSGNNGGDGLELARLARLGGWDVRVRLLAEPKDLRGEAAQALAQYLQSGGELSADLPARTDVFVDALLGTGLDRPVVGAYAGAIVALNEARGRGAGILALDIPSGLSADTGAVLGCAVQADLTVSFIARKLGLYTGQGPSLAGLREFDDLGVGQRVSEAEQPVARLMLPAYAIQRLHPRPRASYKNQHGHVLCIGGDRGYAGAIRLCAEAALRGGAGLVTVATRREHAPALVQARPELMVRGVNGGRDLAEPLVRASIIAIGPGLGRGAWAQDLMRAAVGSGKPIVADADALHWLADNPQLFKQIIITPHPGEAGRLLSWPRDQVEADRPAAVRELARKYGAVAVLKGAGSLICAGDGALYVSAAGNPGMATGGMGDVLCGLIAALWAQGLAAPDAASLGVDIHARAGDLAAGDGERGLLASDLFKPIQRQVNP